MQHEVAAQCKLAQPFGVQADPWRQVRALKGKEGFAPMPAAPQAAVAEPFQSVQQAACGLLGAVELFRNLAEGKFPSVEQHEAEQHQTFFRRRGVVSFLRHGNSPYFFGI